VIGACSHSEAAAVKIQLTKPGPKVKSSTMRADGDVAVVDQLLSGCQMAVSKPDDARMAFSNGISRCLMRRMLGCDDGPQRLKQALS